MTAEHIDRAFRPKTNNPRAIGTFAYDRYGLLATVPRSVFFFTIVQRFRAAVRTTPPGFWVLCTQFIVPPRGAHDNCSRSQPRRSHSSLAARIHFSPRVGLVVPSPPVIIYTT